MDLKNKNILQVTPALQEGGVERGTVEMANFITEQGFGSFVASAGGQMEVDLSDKVTQVHLPLKYRNPFTILYCAIYLAFYIWQHNIHLVHARSRAPAWAAFLACKLTATPFVTTFHGTHKIQNFFKRLYNSVMVRGVRVIAISQFIKRHVMRFYGVKEGLIDIAPRGVDPKIFNPKLIKDVDLQAKKIEYGLQGLFVITLPGRLTRWKGQIDFIKALALLKDDHSWHALIVGSAGKKKAYEEQLQKLIQQKGLEERVTLTGGQKDIPMFYALSDVVVSASTEPEAFGRVAIEAGAMGKCVVATSHGGSAETVKNGETGYLYKAGDTEGMAKILRQTMQDKQLLQQLGANAYTWVQNTFTVERTCQLEWATYMKILGEK